MQTFTEFLRTNTITEAEDEGAMTKWITHQVLNTDRAHDEIKKEFIGRYGAAHVTHFDDVVSKLVD